MTKSSTQQITAFNGFLEGLEIEGYRSFSERVRIAPLGKLNLFIGPNNAGKSNVLRFISWHLPNLIRSYDRDSAHSFTDLDRPRGIQSEGISFAIATLFHSWSPFVAERTGCAEKFQRRILGSPPIFDEKGYCWFRFSAKDYNQRATFNEEQLRELAELFPLPGWGTLSENMRGHPGRGGRELGLVIPPILRQLSPLIIPLKPTSLISALRRVTAVEGTQAEEAAYSGEGLIRILHEFQHPHLNEPQKRRSFDRINEFLREVTESDGAELEVPASADDLYVGMAGRKLPLQHLGTGIHEVIILASLATVRDNEIICIEEPELHLHPHLQRQLVRYLMEKTTNQYFISTHSAHIMDCEGANIFEVFLEGGSSRVRHVAEAQDKFSVCQNLGYRASDLVQANCIIWVEGPSDRIYVRHWLRAIDPDLREGIHYSIMFYGGRLLSNLTVDDEGLERLISLLPINRNVIVVMDRDRSDAESSVNETKLRVESEVKSNGGVAWITAGREIENYVPKEVMNAAITAVSPDLLPKVEKNLGTDWKRCLTYGSGDSGKRSLDKLKVALEVEKQAADLTRLGLGMKIEEIREAIRRFNHMK